jgi:hypothetical protein
VIVRRSGETRTATFATKAQAEHWAKSVELKIAAKEQQRRDFQELAGSVRDGILSPNEILSRSTASIFNTGIYFLILGDEIVYVGKSSNVGARIAEHSSRGRDFDRFHVILCLPGEADELERRYIEAIRPKQNRQFVRANYGLRSESLANERCFSPLLGTNEDLSQFSPDRPESIKSPAD